MAIDNNKKPKLTEQVDIIEDDLIEVYGGEVLSTLLRDHTTGQNIFWATSDYEALGEAYGYSKSILPELITGENNHVIMPRVKKEKALQTARSKDKAEVFTPSWVCNAQNNLIDEAWFARKNVFNEEIITPDGLHFWTPTEGNIQFPKGDRNKTWKKYVRDTRLEITCGEAPYLVSRYDTTTGEPIPIKYRIGLLDRKLRVVGENTHKPSEWLEMAHEAYMNTYGFEWQGDNLLLAREALLMTFVDYYEEKFGKYPGTESVQYIAYIISWNTWQMDGLKMVVPNSCDEVYEQTLFDTVKAECLACTNGETTDHIGKQCLIRDWKKTKPKDWDETKAKRYPNGNPYRAPWQVITFQSLVTSYQMDEDENEE